MSTNLFHKVHQFKVWPPTPISDHCIISMQVDIIPKSSTIKAHGREKIQWDHKQWNKYADMVSSPHTIAQMEACVQDLYPDIKFVGLASSKICHILTSCAKKVFKKRTKYSLPPPWWDDECRTARCKLDVAFKLGRGTRQYKLLRNEYRTLIKNKIRSYEVQQNEELLKDVKHNPQNFWSKFKPQHKDNPIIDLQKWCVHFRKILNREDISGESTFKANDYLGSVDIDNHNFNKAFTTVEVAACIQSLSNNKATADGYISELYKYAKLQVDEGVCINLAASFLCDFFNIIFLHDMPIPQSWTEAYICPIYKGKGDMNDINNYRGLTVVSAIYKIYTTLLCRRLDIHLESKKLRAKTQCGFRSKHSTVTAQFVLAHSIAKTCAHRGVGGQNKALYVCFVDFQKAFDYVLRNKLFDRLRNLGIKGHILSTIVHIYNNTSFKIKVNGILSEEKVTTQNGVKQGCPLSPLLFGVFIDMLHEHLCKSCPHIGVQLNDIYNLCDVFYADDVALLAQSHEDLQALLEALATFCHDTNLLVNIAKTKYMAFMPWRAHLYEYQPVLYKELEVERAQDFNYLGIRLHPCTWMRNSGEARVTCARIALGGLIKRTKQMHIENLDIICRLYETLVNSIAIYGCQVWGVKWLKCDTIDHVFNNPPQNLQLQFLRIISGCHSHICRMSLLKEFKLEPVQVKIAVACAKLWNNTWKFGGIAKECLISDLSLFCKGYRKNWSGMFLECMYNIGVIKYEDWSNIKDRRPHDFYSFYFEENLIRDKFKDRYDNLWPTSNQGWMANNKRSGVAFLKYHNWFYMKDDTQHKHFQANLSQHYMKCLIQFRLGSNCLAINDHSVSKDRRTCPFCTHTLEDEEHFIFNCPGYHNIRSGIEYAHLWNMNQDMRSFFNQNNQASLAQVILKMYKLRRMRMQVLSNNI